MIPFIIFCTSGALILLMLVIQALRLRFTDYVHHGHEEHPVGDLLHETKVFMLAIDRHSMTIFFRVVYRLIALLLQKIINVIIDAWNGFLSIVRANDVREEKGSVSFYLKRVSLEKKIQKDKGFVERDLKV